MYRVYYSNSYNPFFNLAFEEYLVHHSKPKDQILFLWQNQNTVVIGRNQNPWKECNLELLKEQDGKLVRRLSGGGAVYHDLGNLNFTFISSYEDNKVQNNINLMIDMLVLNGINAVFSGKNDILVDGNKISGNAFFVEEDILCHHGTLLYDVNLEKLGNLLTVTQKKLESKGIDSVESRVINLKKLNPQLTIDSLKSDLVKLFLPKGEDVPVLSVDENKINDKNIDLQEVLRLMNHYQSWDWNFGSSPEFNIQISERFSWGELELYLLVTDGEIVEVETCTDALDTNLPQKIYDKVIHAKFDYNNLMNTISKIVELS